MADTFSIQEVITANESGRNHAKAYGKIQGDN